MTRRSWIIDVCRTCDRHAIPPFCEHRRTTERWTTPVTVYSNARRTTERSDDEGQP